MKARAQELLRAFWHGRAFMSLSDIIVSSQKQFMPVMMADVAPLTTLSQLHILGQRFQWLVRASVCYRRIVRGYRALIRL